jgi:hypothetical protein
VVIKAISFASYLVWLELSAVSVRVLRMLRLHMTDLGINNKYLGPRYIISSKFFIDHFQIFPYLPFYLAVVLYIYYMLECCYCYMSIYNYQCKHLYLKPFAFRLQHIHYTYYLLVFLLFNYY